MNQKIMQLHGLVVKGHVWLKTGRYLVSIFCFQLLLGFFVYYWCDKEKKNHLFAINRNESQCVMLGLLFSSQTLYIESKSNISII